MVARELSLFWKEKNMNKIRKKKLIPKESTNPL